MKRIMIFSSLITVLIFCIYISAFSQEKTGSTDIHHSDTNQNDKALQFYLVNDMSVSFLKNIASNQSLRFNVDLSGSFTDTNSDYESNYESPNDTTTRTSEDNSKNNDQNISFLLQYLYFPYQKKHFNVYVGIGPRFGFSRNKSQLESLSKENSDTETSISDYSNSTHQYSLGLSGAAGIQGFISNRLALFAEYKLLFERRWRKSEGERNSEYSSINHSHSKSNYNSWNISLSRVYLGFSVFF